MYCISWFQLVRVSEKHGRLLTDLCPRIQIFGGIDWNTGKDVEGGIDKEESSVMESY